MTDRQLLARITADPKVMAGKPVVRGTRLAVEYLVKFLAHGATEAEVLAEYNGLTADDLAACLLFAGKSLEEADGRNNPTHEKMPMYIQRNLKIPQDKKDSISALINTLRLFREDADYRPHVSVDDQSARDCIRDAATVQQELWGGKWKT